IIDLFSFGAAEPVRIEFWGDEVVSIRRFDILDQRSTDEVRHVDVLPVNLGNVAEGASVRRSVLDVLPRDAILFTLDAEQAEEAFRRTWAQVLHLHAAERRRGGRPEPPDHLSLSPDDVRARLSEYGRLAIVAAPDAEIRFAIREAEAIERDMDRLAALLRAGAARGEDTVILCDNAGQLERLEEILSADGALPPRATLAIGVLQGGFVLEGAEPPLRVLTDHEIFRRARRLRRSRRFRGAVALESLAQLKPGDYVVHLDHGIGRFKGLERIRVGGLEEIEVLAIEYAGGETLRVPVYRLDLIERWVGDSDEAPAPRLHKIGGK